MERIGSLVVPDFGLRTNDVHYMSMESVVRGRGADRLKYLDLEGRWVLSGNSIPYISAAFNHLQRLNDAQVAMRDITEQPLNAIGMVGWTKSSIEEQKTPQPQPRRQPLRESVRVEKEEEEPRESVPYRSAGYGAAHEKRKMSISDRSRSASPTKSIRRGSESIRDPGYGSASPSPRQNDVTDSYRPPHRTQGLSSRPSSTTRMYDNEYDEAILKNGNNDRRYTDELRISTKENGLTTGYGYHEKRMYSVSPRSLGSAGEELSGSELDSPMGTLNKDKKDRNTDEVLLMAYHMSKKTRGESPRMNRRDWIRH